jgi:hypothetical protein
VSLAPLNREEAALLATMYKRPEADRRKALAYLRMAGSEFRTCRYRERNLERAVDVLVGVPEHG